MTDLINHTTPNSWSTLFLFKFVSSSYWINKPSVNESFSNRRQAGCDCCSESFQSKPGAPSLPPSLTWLAGWLADNIKFYFRSFYCLRHLATASPGRCKREGREKKLSFRGEKESFPVIFFVNFFLLCIYVLLCNILCVF